MTKVNKAGIWILALLIVLQVGDSYATEQTDMQNIVKGNSEFALKLYDKLKDSEGNIFFSPYSISTSLAMTYGGARGETEKQMAKVLGFTLEQKRLHPVFEQLEAGLNQIQKKGNIQLSIANSLWPQEGYPFLKDYLDLTKQCYGVSITPLNYEKDPEGARKIINKWVEDKTQEKVKNLIKPDVLDSNTCLVLSNAIYFKGNWASQFKIHKTKNAPFFLLSGTSINVSIMNQTEIFRYADLGFLQILELPYIGKELSMIILLPKEQKGLSELEKKLSIENFNQWQSHMSENEICVFLPKFQMTSEFELNKVLQTMGMVDAFNIGAADFSGMDGTRYLFIKNVIHKAFVDINEKGTEAATATGGAITKAIAEVFNANHPFIFMIRENKTGGILFMGRVVDPTKHGE